jgi:hypothetical protein
MDIRAFLPPLRSLEPIILIVSPEPLDVAEALGTVIKKLADDTRVVTRRGLIGLKEYVAGRSIRYDLQKSCGCAKTPEEMIEIVSKPPEPVPESPDTSKGASRLERLQSAVATFDDILGHDPKDRQFFYLLPDLWPDFNEPHVLASLQRQRDQRTADEFSVKIVMLVTPSLDYVPEVLRSMSVVIEDKGLTSDQVLAKIQYVFGHIDLKEPEKYVDYGVGLSSAQLNRMISACVVRMFERVQGEKGTWRDAGLNPDFFREWREQHVKPRV